jgi:hypothetical protein
MGESKERRAASSKRPKTQELTIHKDCPITPHEAVSVRIGWSCSD